MPLQQATKGEIEGMVMTQFGMDDISRVGLLKLDLLGLANLTTLCRAETQPFADSWETRESSAPRVTAPVDKPPIATGTQQRTVIPVPQLPVAARPSDVRPAPHTPSQPRRLALGTGRLEETVRTQPVPPANDDKTSPYITLPSEVKPVGYAHTKRVAAKQR